MKTSIAIAALVATIVAAGALPAAADDSTPAAFNNGPGQGNHFRLQLNGDQNGPGPGMGIGMGMGRMSGRGLIVLACSDKGTEALDAALLHLSYRLQLTDTQKPLWDSFRDKALTTETSFADQCKSSLPDRTAANKPDLLTVMKGRLVIEQARLAAMNTVLPDFEALYNSLTDQQKDSLMPRGTRDDGMFRMPRPDAPGRTQRPDAPGRMVQPSPTRHSSTRASHTRAAGRFRMRV